MHLPQTLVEQPAAHLGEPVVDAREEREDGSTEEDVVQVRDHKVAVGDLIVERYDCERDAIETTNQEHGNEAKAKEHGGREVDLTAPNGGNPVEDFDGSGNGD